MYAAPLDIKEGDLIENEKFFKQAGKYAYCKCLEKRDSSVVNKGKLADDKSSLEKY